MRGVHTGQTRGPDEPSGLQVSYPATVGDYVSAAVATRDASALISPDASKAIGKIAVGLPAALTRFFGFECPLQTDRATADFLICCKLRGAGLNILSGLRTSHPLPSHFQQSDVWRRILLFSKEWVQPDSPVFQAVNSLWLEFDVDGISFDLPVPSVFIGTDQLRPGDALGQSRRTCGDHAWLTDRALPMLLGDSLDPAVKRKIALCVNRLPPGAHVFQVGLMLARNCNAVRICVRGIPLTQIGGYLEDLEWHTSGALNIILDALAQKVDRVDIDLDITDRVLSKIGLECYLGKSSSQLAGFLDHLVSSGLCTPRKASAIVNWPGAANLAAPRRDLAHGAQTASRQFESVSTEFLERELHHVKLDYRDVKLEQAKAYLGVRLRPQTRQSRP